MFSTPNGTPTTKMSGTVRVAHDAFRLGDDGLAGDDRNARQAGARQRPRPSAGRSTAIEAPVLTGLRRLHQHADTGGNADAPVRAQLGDPRQHLVGAFRRLHRQHVISGDDSGLPDIERTARLQICEAKRNVFPVLLGRVDPAECSFRDQNFRRDLVRSEKTESLLFKQLATPESR